MSGGSPPLRPSAEVAAQDFHVALLESASPRDESEQRGLARTVRADHADEAPDGDFEVHGFEGPHRAIAMSEPGRANGAST
jgi:hypothetical protein